MPAQPPASWQDLFVAGEPAGPQCRVPVRVLWRASQPFLVLPDDPRTAVPSLDLYSAQTLRARLAKSVLALALKFRLPTGLQKLSLTVNPGEPFAAFLAQTAGTPSLPRFAILCGNPNTGGRRFIMLLFDQNSEPAAVVKAGLGDSATGLIDRESAFLDSAPKNLPGIPRARATFQSPRLHALALDFIPGHPPDTADAAGFEPLLNSWIDANRTVPLTEIPAWQRLLADLGPDAPTWLTSPQLKNVACHPALYHGDFAPWNVKISGGKWRAFDWERGEPVGVPGWDWFHYVIQKAVLVRREPPDFLVRTAEQTLASGPFTHYATRARITGLQRTLLLAYLHYTIRLVKPTEGLPSIQSLLDHLSKKPD